MPDYMDKYWFIVQFHLVLNYERFLEEMNNGYLFHCRIWQNNL
jgi:hypothetical protein